MLSASVNVGVDRRDAKRNADCMTQLVTRVAEDLVALVDGLVDDGIVASRSEAVRRGLEILVDRERRRRTGEAIVRGYQALPQTDEEAGWADEATRQMIAEDPW